MSVKHRGKKKGRTLTPYLRLGRGLLRGGKAEGRKGSSRYSVRQKRKKKSTCRHPANWAKRGGKGGPERKKRKRAHPCLAYGREGGKRGELARRGFREEQKREVGRKRRASSSSGEREERKGNIFTTIRNAAVGEESRKEKNWVLQSWEEEGKNGNRIIPGPPPG